MASPRALLALLFLLPTLSLGGASAAHEADAPVVTAWWLNGAYFEPGTQLNLTFNVSDESLIRSVYFSFAHESGQSSYTLGFEDQTLPNGTYTASFTWLDDVRGNYSLNSYYTEDVYGNGRSFSPESFPNGSATRVFLGPSQVNLRVSTLFGPSFGSEGEVLSYAAAVHNMGDKPVGAFNVTYYVDNDVQVVHTVSGLSSGQHAWVPLNWTAVAGEHVVTVVADSGHVLAEANESDNKRFTAVSVSPNATFAPDLTVTDLTVLDESPRDGELIFVNATIRNQGAGNASATDAVLLVDGARHDLRNVTALLPGESVTLTFRFLAEEGTHHVAVAADASKRVAESDEGNNAANVTLAVAPSPRPDLVLEALHAFPSNATEGDTVVVNATVRNAGNASAPSFDASFYVDGWRVESRELSGLAPGESASVTFFWTAVEGRHHLAVVADAPRSVPERDESNNAANVTVDVARAPGLTDLAVYDVRASNLSDGELAFVYATLANQGTEDAGLIHVDFLVDGFLYERVEMEGPRAGVAWTVRFAWYAQAGDHVLTVVADPLDQVPEQDEGNNAASAFVSVPFGPRADVAVTILGSDRTWLRTDLGPLAPNPLHVRTVTIEVANLGAVSTGAVHVALWARAATAQLGSEFIGSAALQDLAPGERRLVEIEWDPVGYVGDVDLLASAFTWTPDADLSNNEDVYRDFVLVGGTGFGVGL